ncbi:response regulator [bacterium]|nr:response regulator [bacterium]
MIEVLLIGANDSLLSTLSGLLSEKEGVVVMKTDSGKVALEKVKKDSLKLVIIDEKVEAETGFKFAETIIAANPMMNLVIVSDLAPEEFHEASEGLGVLTQLPTKPSAEDVDNLITQLRKILSMFP